MAINLWDEHWVFWLGPLLGGPLAAFMYDMFFYTGVADADSSVFKNIAKQIQAWREASKAAAGKAAAAAKEDAAEEEEEEDGEDEDEGAEPGDALVVVKPPAADAASVALQRGVGALSPSQQSARLAQLGALTAAGGALGAAPGSAASGRLSPAAEAQSPAPRSTPPGSIHAMMAAQGSPFLSLVKRGGSPPPQQQQAEPQ